MDAGMQDIIDRKGLAGVVTLVARRGKVVQHKAYGFQDLERQTPMRPDSIARIYSMTKPVTGVAMMIRYDEGKWKPSDPIAKHIPEFAQLTVYAGDRDGQMVLEAPAHPPTMGALMSHSAGFTYGAFGATPVDKAYQAPNPLGSRTCRRSSPRWRSCRCSTSRGRGGSTAWGWISRGISWRSSRASRFPSSCVAALTRPRLAWSPRRERPW